MLEGWCGMKTRRTKILIAIAIGIIIVGAAIFLPGWFAWKAYLASIRPAHEFNAAQMPATPDYDDPSAWAVTPDSPGLSILTPDDLQPIAIEDARADVFFVHPTTYFGKKNWNADIGNVIANQFLENLVVPSQTSVFNGCCRIFAPRYRQATLSVFVDPGPSGRLALQAAYGDVRNAFEHYMAADNDGRPFILASHSQGTLHAIRLLEEVIANADYRGRMVAAYLPGFSLPEDKRKTTLDWLPLCVEEDSVRCLIAWDTYDKKGGPKRSTTRDEHYYADAKGGRWEPRRGKIGTCVNPLSWSPDLALAGKDRHKGATYIVLPGIGNLSLTPKLAPLAKKDISARCGKDGILYISTPSSPVYKIGMMAGKWYHNHDYNLFYANIRENAIVRVNAYLELE